MRDTHHKILSYIKKHHTWALLILAPLPLALIVLLVYLLSGWANAWPMAAIVLVAAELPSFVLFVIMTIVHHKKHKAHHVANASHTASTN